MLAMHLATFVCVGQDEIKAAPTKIKEERRWCEAVDDILRVRSCVGARRKHQNKILTRQGRKEKKS
jgi:hypothetical protein